jgi:polysaccharide deacetylase family protein (PEP-CTERM system associated)
VSAILGFDIEEHWRSYESRGLGREFPHQRDLAVVDRILALLAERRQRATFFVLGEFAEREPSLVGRIVAAGQEVASHGYDHRDLSRHTPESFREDARRSKAILEDQAGAAVLGYRAAQWSLMPSTAWALPILAELGYVYDSSAFPGRIHRYGWPGMATGPHRLELGDGRGIVEFPAARLGMGSWATQACGGFYWRVLPGWMHRCAAAGGCWYFHAYDLDAGYELPPGLPLRVRMLKRLGTARAWERFGGLIASQPFVAHADVWRGMVAA